jgi:hypothetical protein
VPRRTVQDQFAHRLAGRGRVEHAPDTVAGRNEGAVNARHGADEGKAVFRDRPEARLPRFDRRRGERRRDLPTQRFEPRVRTLISCNVGRIDRQRPDGRDVGAAALFDTGTPHRFAAKHFVHPGSRSSRRLSFGNRLGSEKVPCLFTRVKVPPAKVVNKKF